MSSDERSTWLATAWAEVQDMPGSVFVSACAAARRVVEHPAKLVPTIIRESEPTASIIRRRLAEEEAAWANHNAPRLAAAPSGPDEVERAEVSELMRGLIDGLSANKAATDA